MRCPLIDEKMIITSPVLEDIMCKSIVIMSQFILLIYLFPTLIPYLIF